MTEDALPSASPRRSSPLGALRQRWRLAVLVAGAGLLIGVAVGASRGASYTAEARVGVGTGSLAATSVAGYSLGAEEIAADYARSVTTDSSKDTLSTALGSSVTGISAVNASPIPSSAIIRVDVTASSSALALRAAADVTTAFVSSINAAVDGTSASSVLKQYVDIEQQLLPLQNTQTAQRNALSRAQADGTDAAVAAAENALNATTLQVNSLGTQAAALNVKYQTLVSQPQTENGLRPVQSAYLVGSNRHSLIERWGLIGLVLGGLLALAIAAWADSRQVRRRAGRGAPMRAALQTAGLEMVRAGAARVQATGPKRSGPRRSTRLEPVSTALKPDAAVPVPVPEPELGQPEVPVAAGSAADGVPEDDEPTGGPPTPGRKVPSSKRRAAARPAGPTDW